jgi:hypothetical protein
MSRSTIPSLRTYSRLLVMDGTVNYRASKSFYQHKQRQPMALENPWQLIQHLQEYNWLENTTLPDLPKLGV